MPHKAPALAPLALAATLLAASPALGDDFDKKGDDAIAAQKQAELEKGAKMPGEKEKKKVEPPKEDTWPKYDPIEDPEKTYRFIGFRWRNVIVPKFMVNIFADGGRTVNVFMAGPEFTTRKKHWEYDIAIQLADYSFDPFLFKGHSEPDTAFELVASSMKVLFFTFDLLYDIPIDKSGKFSFLVGGGVGVGVVFGNMYRSQAYPNRAGADPNKPEQWNPCSGLGVPDATFCENPNGHFAPGGVVRGKGSYSEPSWANGGSKPNIFPWISLPQVSFRYKPIKQLQTRFDLGFSTSGFFLGASAGYGL